MEKKLILKMLGTRGSVPATGDGFQEFGGATTCVQVIAGAEEIYLDAGSGITAADTDNKHRISILMSHFHLDHMMGLAFFNGLYYKDRQISIYGVPRDGLTVEQAVDRLYVPPYWPIRILDLPANPVFYDLPMQYVPKKFQIGEVEVSAIEGSHPGGCTVYRLTYGGRSVVYATDFEHSSDASKRLAGFATGCDLLIYDGQYTREEYHFRNGFGHSFPEIGMEIARQAGAKRLLFTHHDPAHQDGFLREWEKEIRKAFPQAGFARGGEEIEL